VEHVAETERRVRDEMPGFDDFEHPQVGAIACGASCNAADARTASE
jgi:hypothetical protein